MDGKTLARIGAIAFVALAIVASAVEMTRKPDSLDDTPSIGRPVARRDPLAAELTRCSGIGEAGARDQSCLRAWAENRRRFLDRPASEAAPGSSAPTTLFPSESNAADPVTPASQQAPLEAH